MQLVRCTAQIIFTDDLTTCRNLTPQYVISRYNLCPKIIQIWNPISNQSKFSFPQVYRFNNVFRVA